MEPLFSLALSGWKSHPGTKGFSMSRFPLSPLHPEPGAPPDPHPPLGRAAWGCRALLSAVHASRSGAAAHGEGQPQRGTVSPTCHCAATTQDMLLHPSKERAPKLEWAGWGENSAALILRTQSLLASQGAPSPGPRHPRTCLSAGAAGEFCAVGTSPGSSPRHRGAALPLARTQGRVKLMGCPPSPAQLEGTTAALNRCSSCSAAGA